MRKPSWLRFPPLSQPASPVYTTSGGAREHIANHGLADVEATLEAGGFTRQGRDFANSMAEGVGGGQHERRGSDVSPPSCIIPKRGSGTLWHG
jgi:hypothetical protein